MFIYETFETLIITHFSAFLHGFSSSEFHGMIHSRAHTHTHTYVKRKKIKTRNHLKYLTFLYLEAG